MKLKVSNETKLLIITILSVVLFFGIALSAIAAVIYTSSTYETACKDMLMLSMTGAIFGGTSIFILIVIALKALVDKLADKFC